MDYERLTPNQICEPGDSEAIKHLIYLLINGEMSEQILAASEIGKISLKNKQECNITVPYLIKSLYSKYHQVRYYALSALKQLNIPEEEFDIIKHICENDPKPYIRKMASQILIDNNMNNVILPNEEIILKTAQQKGIGDKKQSLDLDENKISMSQQRKPEIVKIQNIEQTECDKSFYEYKIFGISDKQIKLLFYHEMELEDDLAEEYIKISEEFVYYFLVSVDKVIRNKRQSEILKLRYNFYGNYTKTLRDIGEIYDVSRERVRQIVVKANNRLYNSLMKKRNKDLIELKSLMDNLLKPDTETFNERIILFLKYGFESANTKILLQLIINLLYRDKDIKLIEKDLAKYIDLYFTQIEEIQRKLTNENIFNNKIYSKIVWFEKTIHLDEGQYKKVIPVREVNLDNGFIAGDYYSEKLNKRIQFESQIERDTLAILERSNKVVYYEVQPLKYLLNMVMTENIYLISFLC